MRDFNKNAKISIFHRFFKTKSTPSCCWFHQIVIFDQNVRTRSGVSSICHVAEGSLTKVDVAGLNKINVAGLTVVDVAGLTKEDVAASSPFLLLLPELPSPSFAPSSSSLLPLLG